MLVYRFTGIQLVLKHRHWFTGLQVYRFTWFYVPETMTLVYRFTGFQVHLVLCSCMGFILPYLYYYRFTGSSKICPGSFTPLLLVYRYTSIQLHLVLKQSYINV